MLEEFLTGREHSFDSATLDGQTIWSSISDYEPPPLEVLRNPWIQWTVVLPRDLGGPEYDAIRDVGPAALRALGHRARVQPHGVVRATRRLGGGLRGRRPPARRPDLGHDRLRLRLRLPPRLGRPGDQLHVSDRWSGSTPSARPTCAGRAAAGCGPCTALIELQRGAGSAGRRRALAAPGTARRQLVRGRGIRDRTPSRHRGRPRGARANPGVASGSSWWRTQ